MPKTTRQASLASNPITAAIDDVQDRLMQFGHRVEEETNRQLNTLERQLDKLKQQINRQVERQQALKQRLSQLRSDTRSRTESAVKQQIDRTRKTAEELNSTLKESRLSASVLQTQIRILRMAREQADSFGRLALQYEQELADKLVQLENARVKRIQEEAAAAIQKATQPISGKTAKSASRKKTARNKTSPAKKARSTSAKTGTKKTSTRKSATVKKSTSGTRAASKSRSKTTTRKTATRKKAR